MGFKNSSLAKHPKKNVGRVNNFMGFMCPLVENFLSVAVRI